MSFSQGWDTGFRTILIYVGVVFFWLMVVEKHFPSQSVSVVCMNVFAVALSAFFFMWRRRKFIALKREADAEVAAILAEEG